MTNKERLEMIKHTFEEVSNLGGFLDDCDTNWLIEQVEQLEKRVSELLMETTHLQKRGDEAIREAGQLWTKIYHAKEALK